MNDEGPGSGGPPEPPEPVFEEPALEEPVEARPNAQEAVSEDPPETPLPAEEPVAAAPEEPAPERAPERAPANPPAVPEPQPNDELRITASQAIKPTRVPAIPGAASAEEEPERRAQVISFANQKGGVAKTTTTLNLATSRYAR